MAIDRHAIGRETPEAGPAPFDRLDRPVDDRFESLDISDKGKAELYDSLNLHITWKFPFSAS